MLNETIIWMKHKSNANSLIINGNWLVTDLVNSIMTYHDENEGHHSDKFVAGAKLGNTNVSIGQFDFEFTGANRLAIVFFFLLSLVAALRHFRRQLSISVEQWK